jgi:CRISPR-associated protein Cas1
MFVEDAPDHRSIEQLRGIEGSKVYAFYRAQAKRVGIDWEGRNNSSLKNPIDAALAGVNAALYGLCEACILTLGYSPAIGFVHSGDARSFVFDVADCIKFQTVVPLAFDLAAAGGHNMEHRSRTACRQLFVETKMAESIVEIIVGLMNAADHH